MRYAFVLAMLMPMVPVVWSADVPGTFPDTDAPE